MNATRMTLVSALLLAAASTAHAQRVVAMGDEWMLTNSAFTVNFPAATQLATQLGAFIANGNANANFAVISPESEINPTGQGSTLASTMTGLGYTWSHLPTGPFNLATISAYDGIVVCNGPGFGPANAAILTQYVNSGGSVVVIGGTGGLGGAFSEAAAWNTFLNNFGLQFNAPYIGPPTQIQLPLVPNTNPVGAGVPVTRWSFGHRVTELNPSNPLTDIVFGAFGNPANPEIRGVIGTYAVPAPGTFMILGSATLLVARRRR